MNRKESRFIKKVLNRKFTNNAPPKFKIHWKPFGIDFNEGSILTCCLPTFHINSSGMKYYFAWGIPYTKYWFRFFKLKK